MDLCIKFKYFKKYDKYYDLCILDSEPPFLFMADVLFRIRMDLCTELKSFKH